MNYAHVLFSTCLKLYNAFIYYTTRINYRDNGRMVQHTNITDQIQSFNSINRQELFMHYTYLPH